MAERRMSKPEAIEFFNIMTNPERGEPLEPHEHTSDHNSSWNIPAGYFRSLFTKTTEERFRPVPQVQVQDCLACRTTALVGCSCTAAYLLYQTKHAGGRLHRAMLVGMATGLFGLGLYRWNMH